MNHRLFQAEFNNIATNFKEEEKVPAQEDKNSTISVSLSTEDATRSALNAQNKQISQRTLFS